MYWSISTASTPTTTPKTTARMTRNCEDDCGIRVWLERGRSPVMSIGSERGPMLPEREVADGDGVRPEGRPCDKAELVPGAELVRAFLPDMLLGIAAGG